MRVIDVDPADNFYSIRDRLLQGGRERAVLVLPESGGQLNEIEIALLRRLADRERLDVGLVTADRRLTRQARAIGLPTFSNLTLAGYYRPEWWRASRRAERLGFAHGVSPRTLSPASQSTGKSRRWLTFLVALISVALLFGLLAFGIAFAIPTATISLRPQSQPIQVITDFTADPSLAQASGHIMPARLLELEQPWEASGAATGDQAEDRARISAQTGQRLSAFAPELLAARLNPDEMLVPSSVRIEVITETFDLIEDKSILFMVATLEGLAVREADLNPILLHELSNTLASGFQADPSSMEIQMETITGIQANEFQVTARAIGRPIIDPKTVSELIRGRRVSDAANDLTTALPLAEPPTIDMRPDWWWIVNRLPIRAESIRFLIRP